MLRIKLAVSLKEYHTSIKILHESFGTVADEFNLTADNCPSNAAFISLEDFLKKKNKRTHYYLAIKNNIPIGFVATEQSNGNPETYYIEKLAVLPGYRHNGIGKKLMEFVEEKIRNCAGKRISLGIIAENGRLKDWYLKLGYKDSGTKFFNHLPFRVCFLEKELT
jgi:ribosomal protein S18 acetylase RimI-like enzyme